MDKELSIMLLILVAGLVQGVAIGLPIGKAIEKKHPAPVVTTILSTSTPKVACELKDGTIISAVLKNDDTFTLSIDASKCESLIAP